MTGAESFQVEARSSAPPEVVFALLADATTWQRWAGPLVPRSSWEAGSEQGGQGAVRRLGLGPLAARERIVEHEPPRRLSYEVLSWQPYRDYLAEVSLSRDGGGTRILWSGGFRPRLPGTGPAQRLLLSRVVGGFASRLAAYAATPAARASIGQTEPRETTPSTGEPT